jgi:hypothetical protein
MFSSAKHLRISISVLILLSSLNDIPNLRECSRNTYLKVGSLLKEQILDNAKAFSSRKHLTYYSI